MVRKRKDKAESVCRRNYGKKMAFLSSTYDPYPLVRLGVLISSLFFEQFDTTFFFTYVFSLSLLCVGGA